MTFQLGIVAEDGVILASDQKELLFNYTFRAASTSITDKICLPDGLHLAYCCSGDELATVAAKHLVQSLQAGNGPSFERQLTLAGEYALENKAELEHGIKLHGGAVLLAYLDSEEVRLWRMDISGILSKAEPIHTKTLAGDEWNCAAFFTERYFSKRSINELLLLATHCILMGGALNPAGVEGLEIAVCTASEFRKLTPKELAPLVELSKKLDSRMARSLAVKVKHGKPTVQHA